MVDVVTRQATACVGENFIGNLLPGGEFLAAVSGTPTGGKGQVRVVRQAATPAAGELL
jgi:hypothetical protein